MKKSAIEQVSEQYENAKRELFQAESSNRSDALIRARLEGARQAWAHALEILQSERGNFVG